MKNTQNGAQRGGLLAIALVAVIGFSMAACGDGSDNGGGPLPQAPQTVMYSGRVGDSTYTLKITETIAQYVLYKTTDGTTKTSSGTVTIAGDTLTLTPTGNTPFTVTISASGITAISGTIIFTDGTTQEEAPTNITPIQTTPEILPTAERWWSWYDSSSKATITHSIDKDGVCTIIVSGAPEERHKDGVLDTWKATAGYDYTTIAGKSYEYTFEAWTKSGTRDLHVQYYEDNDEQIWLNETILITAIPTPYTVYGSHLPGNGENALRFQSADKIGTYYVKILEIKEYKLGKLTITNFSGMPGLTTGNDIGGSGWADNNDLRFCNQLFVDRYHLGVYYNVTIKGNTITIPVWKANEEDLTFAPFTGNVTVEAGSLGFYLWNPNVEINYGYVNKAPITFTDGDAIINFRDNMELIY